jgi:rare lipoprotein A
MRTSKLHYVFSFIFILLVSLNDPALALDKLVKGKIQKGSATWYGTKYHGRKTTSGEVYNKNHLTAAHPSLPFGTKVKVTSSISLKSVIVRINDRGPFKGGHIIDLSEAAARKIDLFRHGFSKVTVEVLPSSIAYVPEDEALPEPEPVTTLAVPTDFKPTDLVYPYFVIQAGSFSNQTNAIMQTEKLKAIDQNLPVVVNTEVVKGQEIHRVVAGRFTSRFQAEAFKATLRKKGIPVLVKQVSAAS